MAEVLVFHHVLGLTEGGRGVRRRAARGRALRAHARPGGRADVPWHRRGVAHTKQIGHQALDERADSAASALPEALAYAGFSWGVGSAQRLAQTLDFLARR